MRESAGTAGHVAHHALRHFGMIQEQAAQVFAHLALKAREQLSQVERLATERDTLMKPLPCVKRKTGDAAAIKRLARKHAALNPPHDSRDEKGTTYAIIEERTRKTDLFGVLRQDGHFVLLLNPDHPFYKQTYKPLAESDNVRDKELLGAMQQEQVLKEFLRRWSAVGRGIVIPAIAVSGWPPRNSKPVDFPGRRCSRQVLSPQDRPPGCLLSSPGA